MSGLERISIGLRTFLRDEKLFRSIDDIRRTMPEVKMIIADDGEQTEEKDSIYAELIRDNHKVIICPFDSGFGFKANRIADALDTEFCLISSDDFSHGEANVRLGIEKLMATLNECPELDIVSGRVNNRQYEMFLDDMKETVREDYADTEPKLFCDGKPVQPRYYGVHLTVNYSLIRRSVFFKTISISGPKLTIFEGRSNIGWDSNCKIGGGEHGAFFLDLKRAGFKVGYVPGVNINQQIGQDSERYRQHRNRARSPERPCFEKRGIRKYVLANGIVDYERKEQ